MNYSKQILFFLTLGAIFTQFTIAQTIRIHTETGITFFQLADIDSVTFTLPSQWVDLGNLHDPALEVQFDEGPQNHSMHITSDGQYYYTINGGNTGGIINQYTLAGEFVQAHPIAIDGRGLSYNRVDGFFYASVFTADIVRITNLSEGSFSLIYENKMQNAQASFAISPDGTKFYDFYQGTLNVYNFFTGDLIETLNGLSYGAGNYGGEAAVAVDDTYIYTWDATIRTVFVYTLAGAFVRSLSLSDGDNGISLSFVDGYLFVSKDPDGSIGTWYGYNIRLPLIGKPVVQTMKKTIASSPLDNSEDTTK